MRKLLGLLAAGLLCSLPVHAQATSSQTGISVKAGVEAQAGGQETKAQSSAQATQQTRAQAGQQQEKDKQAKASASGSAASSASAQAGGNSASVETGTTFEAELSKSLDAKKNRPGDRVEAKSTKDVKSNGEVIVPKNSKLIGRVTEAKARGEGQSESSLGVVFEKAVTKDGREIPLNVVIQAVAASRSALAAQSSQPDLMGSSEIAGSGAASGRAGAQQSGGLVGGVTSTVGSTVGATTGAVGSVGQTAGATLGATTQTAGSLVGGVGGLDAMGNLTSSSSGMLGLQGMTLQSESTGTAQGSLITSTSRNVRLDSGTRLLLRAVGESNAQNQ